MRHRLVFSRNRLARLLAATVSIGLLAGCSVFSSLPDDSGLETRLAVIPTEGAPLKGRTVIYWDEHQIPYVEAEFDQDAAFALGLAQAHLRLGQLELARRLSQGRLSEMVGSVGYDVDRALRTFRFDRAVPEMEAALPPETRLWMTSFVDGINHYLFQVEELPLEFQVASLEREPWTVADILTIGRVASSDLNWFIWFSALPLREREDWPEILAALIEQGTNSTASFEGMEFDQLNEVLGGFRFSGSNAITVGGSRTRSGHPILANDPHVGYLMPSIWMLAGVKSPSYHMVGVMPVSQPFFAMGRNPVSAWGGTAMRALSSSMYDVSGLRPDEISERTETLKSRFGGEREITVRETQWGPIISDVPPLSDYDLPPTVLRWTGHLASDEVTSMLAANRARNFAEFRSAFAEYGQAAMNMLYAGTNGEIGHVLAARLPRREMRMPTDIIVDPAEFEPAWQSLADASTLPAALNPEIGFIANGNNRPAEIEIPIGVFFSTNDRIERMQQIMEEKGKVSVDDIKAMHEDVYMQSSVRLRDVLVENITELGGGWELTDQEELVLRLVADWDGHYRADSRGAFAYELLRNHSSAAFYGEKFDAYQKSGFVDVISGESILIDDIQSADDETLAPALRAGLTAAGSRIERYENWGDAHRVVLTHPFALIPLVGDQYRFGNLPFGGSSQTLMKAGHNRYGENYTARYGASARFVADLSGLDSSYGVILGGQDGWFNSSSSLDQLPLMLEGEYVPLPLQLDAVRARARYTTTLRQ